MIVNTAWETLYFRRGFVIPPARFQREEQDYRRFFEQYTEPVFRRGGYRVFRLLSPSTVSLDGGR